MPLSAAWRPEAADHLLDEDVVELLGRRTAHVAKTVLGLMGARLGRGRLWVHAANPEHISDAPT